MAYITLQPELIQELVDLVRVRTEPGPLRDSVPLDLSVLAVHCLAALVHTRYEYYKFSPQSSCNTRAVAVHDIGHTIWASSESHICTSP